MPQSGKGVRKAEAVALLSPFWRASGRARTAALVPTRPCSRCRFTHLLVLGWLRLNPASATLNLRQPAITLAFARPSKNRQSSLMAIASIWSASQQQLPGSWPYCSNLL